MRFRVPSRIVHLDGLADPVFEVRDRGVDADPRGKHRDAHGVVHEVRDRLADRPDKKLDGLDLAVAVVGETVDE